MNEHAPLFTADQARRFVEVNGREGCIARLVTEALAGTPDSPGAAVLLAFIVDAHEDVLQRACTDAARESRAYHEDKKRLRLLRGRRTTARPHRRSPHATRHLTLAPGIA